MFNYDANTVHSIKRAVTDVNKFTTQIDNITLSNDKKFFTDPENLTISTISELSNLNNAIESCMESIQEDLNKIVDSLQAYQDAEVSAKRKALNELKS